jgi:hypothetical protein
VAVIATVGKGITLTITVLVPIQFTPALLLIALTVYIVVILGVTVFAPNIGPLVHVKVFPPVAVRVMEEPRHTVEFGLTLICGKNTLTVKERMLEQPVALRAPVAVYTVVTVGLTTSGFPLKPVLQVYPFAPVMLRVTDCPEHMMGLLL